MAEKDWDNLEQEIANALSSNYRKVWLAYTRLGDVQIICFPHDTSKTYEIYTAWKVQPLNGETIKEQLLKQVPLKSE